jgi:hypothetical protein
MHYLATIYSDDRIFTIWKAYFDGKLSTHNITRPTILQVLCSKKYFYKKQTKSLADITKNRTFAPVFKESILKYTRLGYGVMVTLQILVLPFLVRVRVPQQRQLFNAIKFQYST